jgi:hypothetical protein
MWGPRTTTKGGARGAPARPVLQWCNTTLRGAHLHHPLPAWRMLALQGSDWQDAFLVSASPSADHTSPQVRSKCLSGVHAADKQTPPGPLPPARRCPPHRTGPCRSGARTALAWRGTPCEQPSRLARAAHRGVQAGGAGHSWLHAGALAPDLDRTLREAGREEAETGELVGVTRHQEAYVPSLPTQQCDR